MAKFRKAQVEFGKASVEARENNNSYIKWWREINKQDYKNHELKIEFKKRFDGIPCVTLSAVGTNQNVIAENVTPTGFSIILSDEAGFNDKSDAAFYQIHWHAVYVFQDISSGY